MAQLDPLGIMDADLDSCVPTDIITSSDKLGEELHPPSVLPGAVRYFLVQGKSLGPGLFLELCCAPEDCFYPSGTQKMFCAPETLLGPSCVQQMPREHLNTKTVCKPFSF